MNRIRTSRICIICLLASFLSGVTQSASGFSFGVSNNSSSKDQRTTTNRPWGNIGTFKPALKYEPPPIPGLQYPGTVPGTQYLGAAPGTGWYATQVPGVGSPAAGGQPVVEVETGGAVYYEQQNIVYTVRVVSSDNLKTLNPAIPRIEGATMEQVDGPVASTRKSRRNGAREIINEYHFKLTPLRSGEIVIPAIVSFLKPDGQIVALIKPQFEVGKDKVGKGGIVKDEVARQAAIDKVITAAKAAGLDHIGTTDSPIAGTKGNKEFLAIFKPQC